ncbi:uridine kinase [Glutamicibacter sp.]|uniref:uridine kinase family protein n=1 Tax=Glutamicibacter sp. TaxID=1931995 RepID=UPI0028BDF901|nr:uridine kinase [Glutamicibacter sp.]
MKSVPSSSTPVILIGGPSGSGKSYLAARFGNPHLPLDEFYRQISEDGNPTDFPRTDYGEIDWDHPGTWNIEAALNAIDELLVQGRTMVPNYSIATSSYSGHREVTCDGGPIIAEGIFLSEILEPLRAKGINVQAYYVDEPALVTTIRRFIRDVSERRKPLLFLIKRGYALFRAHGAGREAYRTKGFSIIPKSELKKLLASFDQQD